MPLVFGYCLWTAYQKWRVKVKPDLFESDHEVLAFLWTILGGDPHDDRSAENDRQLPQSGNGLQAHRGPARYLREHSEILPSQKHTTRGNCARTSYSTGSTACHRHTHLLDVREACGAEPRTEGEEVLFRRLQVCLVERASGSGEAQGDLSLHLPDLRRGVHRLREVEPEILLP